jgi:tetratricopeptide (TPR) repeat protein
VFSLYALITLPNLFQATISENPFMNPDNAERLLPLSEQFFRKRTALRHHLYIRCEKNERAQQLEPARRFAALLDSTKPLGFKVKVEFKEPSGDFIPALPFSEALRSIFAGHKLPADFRTSSLQDILNYYEQRSEEYGFPVDPPDLMLTFEGGRLQQRGMMREAIEIFNHQLQLNPKSLNALLQLGESYRGLGEFEEARKCYKGFLDIRQTDAAFIQRRLGEMERVIDSSAAYRIEKEIRRNGIQSALKTYRQIKADPSRSLYFAENEFNAMGYRLMGAGNLEAALEIFKLNVQLNPQSANVYDSLGEVYLKVGDNDNARKHYKKSLELNPQNTNAREVLKQLEKK